MLCSPFAAAALSLLSLAAPAVEAETVCSDVANLGTASLSRFDAAIDIVIDDACTYTWTLAFKHDATLPVPNDPATQCNPANAAIAPDGLPYLAKRWSYQSVSDDFMAATGIDHISLDFNPCGHPPMDVFTVPHYDIHPSLLEYQSASTME